MKFRPESLIFFPKDSSIWITSQFHDVVWGITFLNIAFHHRVLPKLRIRLRKLKLNFIEPGRLRRPKHLIGRNIEDLIRRPLRLLVDVEVEQLERFGVDAGHFSLGVHLEEPVITRHVHVRKVSNNNVSARLDLILAPLQDLFEHIKTINKGANRILSYDAVHLVVHLEALVEHVGANQLELIGDAFLLKSLPRTVNHTLGNIDPIHLLRPLLHQLLPAWTKTAAHLQKSLALNTLLDHLLEDCVVGVLLHEDGLFAPDCVGVCGFSILSLVFISSCSL